MDGGTTFVYFSLIVGTCCIILPLSLAIIALIIRKAEIKSQTIIEKERIHAENKLKIEKLYLETNSTISDDSNQTPEKNQIKADI